MNDYLSKSEFNSKNIGSISGTCLKLYRWIYALYKFHNLKYPNEIRQMTPNENVRSSTKKKRDSVIKTSSTQKVSSKESIVRFSHNDVEFEVKAALEEVNITDMRELKSLTNPPYLVKMTLECVCFLLHGPFTATESWRECRRMLSDCSKFLAKLRNYDISKISGDTMDAIRAEYITNPRFDPKNIAHVSKTCAGLCKWVQALEKYERLSKVGAIAYLKN